MISLFGGLVRFARLHIDDESTHESMAKKLGVTSEEVLDFENNVLFPTPEVIEAFSKEFDIEVDTLNFYIFHDDKPSTLSKRFRKFTCVQLSKLVNKLS